MYKAKMAVIAVIMAFAAGCTNDDKKVDANFERVKIGERKNAVVAIMGKPSVREYSNLLGISKETFAWSDSRSCYSVVMINDLVVAKDVSKCTQMKK